MDGINPTLAFVALLFGLSGNPREAANELPAGIELDRASGCPAQMVAGNSLRPPGPETWAEEFWNTAAGGSTAPDWMGRSWMESALVAVKGSHAGDDLSPVARHDASYPIMRRPVSAGAIVPAAIPRIDPCRPKP